MTVLYRGSKNHTLKITDCVMQCKKTVVVESYDGFIGKTNQFKSYSEFHISQCSWPSRVNKTWMRRSMQTHASQRIDLEDLNLYAFKEIQRGGIAVKSRSTVGDISLVKADLLWCIVLIMIETMICNSLICAIGMGDYWQLFTPRILTVSEWSWKKIPQVESS